MTARQAWGWAGTTSALLSIGEDELVSEISRHHHSLLGSSPSRSQELAWKTEWRSMLRALSACVAADAAAKDWGVAFEYELPLEGGRRPDVVVLAGETVVVIEFKEGIAAPTLAAVDQVCAYARDIAEYHEVTHQNALGGRERGVVPVLLLSAWDGPALHNGRCWVTNPPGLGALLAGLSAPGRIDLVEWLDSAYAPLPTLVRAAKTIFEHEDLPHVRRAQSARIPETVELVLHLAEESRVNSARRLILVSGVPGAGKTLVGLRAVYEHSTESAVGTFLSGNGPLVKVLQDALKSTVFVKDLHRYIHTYGINEKQPREHLVIFDEAQRAWDRSFMQFKRRVDRSEPELLIAAAMRLPDWAAFVGLVGDGQEIHSGEEGGLGQWAAAIEESGGDWEIHCPPRLGLHFAGLPVVEHELLDLTTSLRSRQAERLHDWVAALLAGNLEMAADEASGFDDSQFVMYLSRDIDEISEYCNSRYVDDPVARFGLVASSHAKNLPAAGVDNSWIVTSRMNLARWYNADPDDPESCRQLVKPVTEFGCQGLELDMPIVAWGSDMRWSGSEWVMTPIRRRVPLDDPEAILINAYRVLLTRGRDGFVVFVPPTTAMDETVEALAAAGVTVLADATASIS